MIEKAKTSRSSCRSCRQKIGKGELRFGVLDTTYSSSGSMRWHHLACADRLLSHEVETYLRSGDCPYTREELRDSMRDTTESVSAPDWLMAAPEGPLPKLFDRWSTPVSGPDGPLSPAVVRRIVLALRGPNTELLPRIEAWLGPDLANGFARAVFSFYEGVGTLRDSWIYGAIEPWLRVGPTADVAAAAVERLKHTNKARGDALLTLLADIGSDDAVVEMLKLHQRFIYKGMHNRTEAPLQRMARRRRVRVQDILDTVTFGLTTEGLELPLGPRTLVARVTPRLEVVLYDGDTRTKLARRSSDDPTLYDDARRVLTLLRKQLSPLYKLHVRRLERMMTDGRTWTHDAFQTLLARPISGVVVRGLIWMDGGRSFRIDEAGEPADVEDEPMTLTGSIRLAHAADLGHDARTWATVLADYEVMAPFDQLERPSHVPAAVPSPWMCVEAFQVEQGPLHGSLIAAGWVKDRPDDQVRIRSFYRNFDGVIAHIMLEPGLYPWGDDAAQTFAGLTFSKSPPRRVLSEAMYVVQRLSRRAI